MAIKLEPATLTNIVDGEMERQFQEKLRELAEIYAASEDYEHSGGSLQVGINAEIIFSLHAETRTVSVGGRVVLKSPKPRRVIRAAWIGDEGVEVDTAVQADWTKNVTPIRGGDDDNG